MSWAQLWDVLEVTVLSPAKLVPDQPSLWHTSFLPKRLWGPWRALGCSCSCIHPCSSPLFCQTVCLLSRAGPRYFPVFHSSHFSHQVWLHLPGMRNTDLCSHWFVLLRLRDRQTPLCFSPCLQEPVTVSSHVVTISSLTPATSYNCSVTTFSHNSPSIPTFIAVSTMGKQPFPAFFFFLTQLHLFPLAFWSCPLWVVCVMKRVPDVDGTGWGCSSGMPLEKAPLDLEKCKLGAQFCTGF